MAHFDLTPHLVFAEHRAIWRSMKRAIDGWADGFWWRTFLDIRRERADAHAWALMRVLDWSPQLVVDDSDDGVLIFMLAYARLVRCTNARQKIHAASREVERLWQVPDKAWTGVDEVMDTLGVSRRVRVPAVWERPPL